jgi:hypothetical protein
MHIQDGDTTAWAKENILEKHVIMHKNKKDGKYDNDGQWL